MTVFNVKIQMPANAVKLDKKYEHLLSKEPHGFLRGDDITRGHDIHDSTLLAKRLTNSTFFSATLMVPPLHILHLNTIGVGWGGEESK